MSISRRRCFSTLAMLVCLGSVSAPAQVIGGQLQTHFTLPTGGISATYVGDIDRDGSPDYAVGTSYRWSPSTVKV